MYNVLLVDDEVEIINTLQNNVDWASYGVENIFIAHDGLEALDVLAANSVNLMISDIKMPNLDGISLLHKVRAQHPHVRCIILSSFREFSFAQEAIKLGVENYLLKPLNHEELDQSIRKCINNLSMHKHVMQSLFMDNVLYRWITGDISKEDLAERSKHIQVNIYFRNYCVVLVKTVRQNTAEDLLSAFLRQLQSKYDAYHFIDYSSQHVLILGGHTVEQQTIYGALQKAIEQTGCQENLTAAIGSVVVGSDQVVLSYRSAMDCMFLSTISSEQHIHIAEDPSCVDITDYQLNQIVTHLKESMDSDDTIDSAPLFREIFSPSKDFSVSALNSFVNMLSARLLRLLVTLGLVDPNAEQSIMISTHHFEEIPSEETLYSCFCDILTMNLMMMKKHLCRLSPICTLAMQYVANNFMEYVSIKDFCSQHNINASYFGFLFKKETGTYFNDYLNQIRINHAMTLLKNTNHKISQISKMSGFSNTSYFIQCFKKRTGLSPSNFKQLISQ